MYLTKLKTLTAVLVVAGRPRPGPAPGAAGPRRPSRRRNRRPRPRRRATRPPGRRDEGGAGQGGGGAQVPPRGRRRGPPPQGGPPGQRRPPAGPGTGTGPGRPARSGSRWKPPRRSRPTSCGPRPWPNTGSTRRTPGSRTTPARRREDRPEVEARDARVPRPRPGGGRHRARHGGRLCGSSSKLAEAIPDRVVRIKAKGKEEERRDARQRDRALQHVARAQQKAGDLAGRRRRPAG